ncbi:MAG: hypothetical protein HYX72_01925 [Acidobacteria bacterium]|nr:hypothetical protein [Acidobacteriota bacterium]
MKKISGTWFLWTFFWTVLVCNTGVAQEKAEKTQEKEPIDTKTTTRVTLGSSSGTPGTSVVVPIYFTPAEGAQVGQLKVEVNFVSANLKFDKVDRGIAAEMGDVELKNELQTAKNDKGVETSTLQIQAQAPPNKPIPAGLLGYITLKISETGRPANIGMRAAAEGADIASKPLTNIRAFDAQVEVLAPGTQPTVACFFFSH